MRDSTDRRQYLVTGGFGCIGAWVVRQLILEGHSVVSLDIDTDSSRMASIMSGDQMAKVTFATGDVTDLEALEHVIDAHETTNVIHLAALQVPACKSDPPLGALVNVVGTTHVFEAVKRRRDRMGQVVYASSVAAYDAADAEAAHRPGHGLLGIPRTHYGVYKRANEGSALVYWEDEGIRSIGLRPYVVYGVGRDEGVTAAPTWAMLAAATGQAYHIPFGGSVHMQHVADVARSVVIASQTPYDGAGVFNLGGSVVHMRDVVEAIETVAPEAAGTITFDDRSLPFPAEVEYESFAQAMGEVPSSDLVEGVRDTIGRFTDLVATGLLSPGALDRSRGPEAAAGARG